MVDNKLLHTEPRAVRFAKITVAGRGPVNVNIRQEKGLI